jgi:hypothetical protein
MQQALWMCRPILVVLLVYLITACETTRVNERRDPQTNEAVTPRISNQPVTPDTGSTAEASLSGQAIVTSAALSLAECLVTPYSSEQQPPDADPITVFQSTWYGNDALWAGLAPAYAGRWYAGSEGLKVLWWRAVEGTLTVRGRRLDANAPPLEADIPDGYGTSGIPSTRLVFPSEGCWEVVGQIADEELRFVVEVRPESEHPIK